MKIKKLVSAVSALTIAVSAFAGMAVVGHAATELYKATYDTEAVDWSGHSASTIGYDADKQAVYHAASGSGNRTAHAVATTMLTQGAGVVSFDFQVSKSNGTANRSSSEIAIGSGSESATTNSSIDEANRIFSLTSPTYSSGYHDGTYYINNNSEKTVTISYGTWYTITAVVDLTEKTADVTVTPTSGGDAIYSGETTFTASAVGSIFSKAPRGGVYTYFDNFVITAVTMPSFTVETNEVGIAADETTTVDVTDIVGDVTVAVDDSAIAEATYADGVVTITGKTSGVAKVTVTATNDGFTKDEEITVAVGSVEYADVTVKYEDADGNTLKPDATVAECVVGATYEATEVDMADIADVVIGGVHYSATLNPESATSVEIADGAVLTLVFDKTETTYAPTVNTHQNTVVTITGTSTSGVEVSKTVVSNSNGVATFEDVPAGEYDVTAAKSGYTAETGVKLTVDYEAENTATVAMTTTDESDLFVENFDDGNYNVTNTKGNHRMYGGKYQVYNSATTMSFLGFPEVYNVSIPGISITYNNAEYATRSANVRVSNDDVNVVELNASVTGHSADNGGSVLESATLTVGDTTYTDVPISGDMTVSFNTLTGAVTVSYAGLEYTGTTEETALTSVTMGSSNQLYVAISSVKVSGADAPELPIDVPASLVEDFADEAAEDSATGASIWTATISGTGATYKTITATAIAADDTVATGTTDVTTVTTTGDVSVIVVVNKMYSLLKSIVISVAE